MYCDFNIYLATSKCTIQYYEKHLLLCTVSKQYVLPAWISYFLSEALSCLITISSSTTGGLEVPGKQHSTFCFCECDCSDFMYETGDRDTLVIISPNHWIVQPFCTYRGMKVAISISVHIEENSSIWTLAIEHKDEALDSFI